ncbi:acid phosphatase [Aphanothece hegewaldii CCALA 016]|uniref:Acid phosphatase n=1 Tax=Aphanothece hegewaldii CCALA 016 TaxID=2107694 RepID=A0A2T1LWS5_9CHRO|nr:divergent PAP2 family protein [Aphanothece hegewaldii]PSF36610.1 acid phosphatase [Aphanothece hegewaldii CCALA 016]
MQEFNQIFNNHILIISIAACLIAQLLKLIIELIRHGKVNLKFLVTTGGMPSAHSALVSSLATGVGLKEGWDSAGFAIACLFAVIVMYDAAGVRQAAGKQARILNQILDGFFQDGKEVNEERLKELLGHTPFQVLVGLALGVGISLMAAPTL